MSDEKTPNPFNAVFDWFVKDAKSGIITILVVAVIYLWFQNGSLQQARIDDKDKFKDEIVKEVRAQIKPDIKEIKDSVLSSKLNMDTTLNNVNNYVNSQK